MNRLARRCGVPQSVLHSWLHGVLPSAKNLHHIAALAKCFDISLSALLFNQSDLKSPSSIVLNSEFIDGEQKFLVSIEKVKKEVA